MKPPGTLDPCHHCGACVSLCAWDDAEQKGLPANPLICRRCQICYRVCACLPDRGQALSPDNASDVFGAHLAVYSVSTTSTTDGTQDGGFVTKLGEYLLSSGFVDAVLVTGRDSDWTPRAFWAEDAAQMKRAAGSKYSVSPTLSSLQEGLERFDRVALVLLPCQSTAISRLRNVLPEWRRAILLVIGLFCTQCFSHDPFVAILEQNLGQPIKDVRRFDIRRGRLIAAVGDTTASWPISDFQHAVWPRCRVCTDLSAETADISVGASGSNTGSNTVVVRSPRARTIVDCGANARLWSLRDIEDPAALQRQCSRKRQRVAMLSREERRKLGPLDVRGNWKRREWRARLAGVETGSDLPASNHKEVE